MLELKLFYFLKDLLFTVGNFMGFSLLVAFALYFLSLILIGALASSYNSSSEDFHLGGRKINYWITAISAHASDMSSWLFLALPFSVYTHGFLQCWIPLGLVAGMWANWQFIAPRLRRASENLESETIPDFLAKSVNDSSGLIKFICSFFCIFFFLFYIASGLKGIGFLLQNLFSLPVETGIFLSSFVIVIYVMLGGFFAISFVGAFQGIFLLLMLLLVPIAMKSGSGQGWIEFYSSASEAFSKDSESKAFFSWDGLWVALSWGLGYFGLPHILSKFMGIDSVKSLIKSKYVGLSWQVLALGASVSVGILAKAYFPLGGVTEDTMFIQIVRDVFSTFFAGLVFCAMLAATISTVDSQIMVAATSITKDVFHLNGKKSVLISRVCILVITLMAACLAALSDSSIDALVRYAWVGQGASFGPLVISVLFFGFVTPKQAAIGMIIGAFLSVGLPFTNFPFKSYPMIPAFSLSLLFLYFCSRFSLKK